MIDEATVEQFRVSLRGNLIQPDDEGYDEARKVYNGMIDKRPRMIARCSGVADVIASVNFARENDVLLAVRGGGHNGGGLSIADDGLVIDLSRMRGVHVDPEEHTVRVEGGSTWGEVDHAAHPLAFRFLIKAFGFGYPLDGTGSADTGRRRIPVHTGKSTSGGVRPGLRSSGHCAPGAAAVQCDLVPVRDETGLPFDL